MDRVLSATVRDMTGCDKPGLAKRLLRVVEAETELSYARRLTLVRY